MAYTSSLSAASNQFLHSPLHIEYDLHIHGGFKVKRQQCNKSSQAMKITVTQAKNRLQHSQQQPWL